MSGRVTHVAALRPIFICASRISLSALVRNIMFLNFFYDCERSQKRSNELIAEAKGEQGSPEIVAPDVLSRSHHH